MDVELLGVRAKVYCDGRVAVLRYQRIGDKIVKYYLDNDGVWQEVGEGEAYPSLGTVFHEPLSLFDVDDL